MTEQKPSFWKETLGKFIVPIGMLLITGVLTTGANIINTQNEVKNLNEKIKDLKDQNTITIKQMTDLNMNFVILATKVDERTKK